MSKEELDKKSIEALLPHREQMLLIDKVINIKHRILNPIKKGKLENKANSAFRELDKIAR